MKKFKLFLFLFLSIFCFSLNVSADEYGSEFKKISTDGKVKVNVVTPKDCEQAQFMVTAALQDYIDTDNYYLMAGCHLEGPEDEGDISILDVSIGSIEGEYNENHILTATYLTADEKIAKKVNDAVSKLKILTMEESAYPKNGYILSDLYLINYLNASDKVEFYNPESATKAINFTKDIIDLTNGSNITYKVGVGAGQDFTPTKLFQSAIGELTVFYNKIGYATIHTGITEAHYLYVDPDATDFAKAAEERINNYLGSKVATVVLKGTLDSLNYQMCDYSTFDYRTNTCNDYIEYNYNSEELFDEDKLVDNNYYEITINEKTYNFVLYKGTEEELKYPSYLGSDVISNVKITSDSTLIPLDASLNVSNVVDKEIENKLETSIYAAYDISLYSNAKKANIEKLDNGKFLVSIPVPENLEGKEITVYYITSKGEKEEHVATVKDKVALFETDHFSTYILTEKPIINPTTSDKVIIYSILGTISLISIIGLSIYLNKKYN